MAKNKSNSVIFGIHKLLFVILFILVIAAVFFIWTDFRRESIKIDGLSIKYFDKRADGAIRITNCYPRSCQNPVFSPDGEYLIFTRFKNGYNKGPAEIVKINLETKKEEIIINLKGDNVNVPFGSWIDKKIVFAYENGVAMASDDGSDLDYLSQSLPENFYIEPVFNPTNTEKIVFELDYLDHRPHQILLLERDKNNKITYLTEEGDFDDRLPSWSPDGKKILWQRYIDDKGWQIFLADLVLDDQPHFENIASLTYGSDDTDNSWTWDEKFILSSRTGDGKVPNIFAFSLKDKVFQRITQSEYEDGAPSHSPRRNLVAFESHRGDENSPSDIWIIEYEMRD